MNPYSFKGDQRITGWEREQLRDFCSALDGDVAVLANAFGLKVFREEMLPYERGYLEKVPSLGSTSGWVIKMNDKDKPEVQSFTIAHELGHFVLHKPHLASLDVFDGRINHNVLDSKDPFSYLDKRDKLMESEANAFAAALLMPLNQVRPAFERLNGDVRSLAKLFFVSETAVSRRITELRL
jgi:Zn-dependent peptidase ImmA (M78 family)